MTEKANGKRTGSAVFVIASWRIGICFVLRISDFGFRRYALHSTQVSVASGRQMMLSEGSSFEMISSGDASGFSQ